jgi:hypothetical protein
MEKIVNKGFVCFFDILGYKSILKNNINDCAKIIKEILLQIPDTIKDDLIKIGMRQRRDEELKKFFTEHFHRIMVSDSILIFFDFDKIEESEIPFFTMIALLYIRNFQSQSFKKGLPMRGAVDFGEYYFYDNLFAGETIINTYTAGGIEFFRGYYFRKDI